MYHHYSEIWWLLLAKMQKSDSFNLQSTKRSSQTCQWSDFSLLWYHGLFNIPTSTKSANPEATVRATFSLQGMPELAVTRAFLLRLTMRSWRLLTTNKGISWILYIYIDVCVCFHICYGMDNSMVNLW
jgi:hypothetical protein